MTSQLSKRNIVQFSALIVIAALLGACATIEPARKPIGKYAQATRATSAVVGEYLSSINQFERDSEYRFLVWQPHRAMDVEKLRASPFSVTAINARLQVIGSLGRYGELLMTLIDTDLAGPIDSALEGLKVSLSDGLDTINQIRGDDEQSKAKEYVGPLTQLLGIATNVLVENIREEALKEAIKVAHPSVQTIITLMEEDMSIALDRREIGLDTLLTAASIRYARYQKKNSAALGQANPSESLRLDLLTSTRDLLAEERALMDVRGNVAVTLGNFGVANNALLKYASGEAELSEMILRVQLFLDSAEATLAAVRELKAIQ